MTLLLDTHIWLWFVRGDSALPRAFDEAIREPQNAVVLSVVSAWEVQIKTAIGKLHVGRPVDEFLDDAVLRFDMLDVSMRHIRALGALPLHHRDPFDRLIVAQALVEKVPIVGRDQSFDNYGVQRIW